MRLKSLTFRNRNRNRRRRRRRDGSRMTWTLLLFAPFALFVPAKADHLAAQQFSDRIVAEEDSSLGPLALREVVTGLDHPWAVAVLPNGDFLITERPGRLLYVATGGDRHISVVEGVPEVFAAGQGGLLDVVLSPTFERDRLVYFSYARPVSGGAVTAVSRGRLVRRGRNAALTDQEVLFTLNRVVGGGVHFGSRLAFDRNGLLYITVGERGQAEQAQDPSNHQGSVVRLNPDGSVPAGNPVRIETGASAQVLARGLARGLYTWGHRNAQGIAVHPDTGQVWLHEHGPRGGDEINVLRAGANYGWPLVTYGVAYSGRKITEHTSRLGFEDPLLHWTPSIAPSGMAFVSSAEFPQWRGDILVGALAGKHLRRVHLDSAYRPVDQEVLFQGFARFRDVRNVSDGSVYLLTDAGPDGGLYRLERRR